jgi:chromosomal replication initiation ATPase DnaA
MSALDGHMFWRSDVEKAAAFTGFTVDEIMGRKRDAALCETRWAIWRVMHERGVSYAGVARRFKRDHVTVISGLRKAESLHDSKAFSMLLEALRG